MGRKLATGGKQSSFWQRTFSSTTSQSEVDRQAAEGYDFIAARWTSPLPGYWYSCDVKPKGCGYHRIHNDMDEHQAGEGGTQGAREKLAEKRAAKEAAEAA